MRSWCRRWRHHRWKIIHRMNTVSAWRADETNAWWIFARKNNNASFSTSSSLYLEMCARRFNFTLVLRLSGGILLVRNRSNAMLLLVDCQSQTVERRLGKICAQLSETTNYYHLYVQFSYLFVQSVPSWCEHNTIPYDPRLIPDT